MATLLPFFHCRIVLIASFVINAIVDGIIFSFGMLNQDLVTMFNSSDGTVAWVGSMQAGFYLLAGRWIIEISLTFVLNHASEGDLQMILSRADSECAMQQVWSKEDHHHWIFHCRQRYCTQCSVCQSGHDDGHVWTGQR